MIKCSSSLMQPVIPVRTAGFIYIYLAVYDKQENKVVMVTLKSVA